ncbi:hypothetical protein TI03_03320 [Achromatium sp. WMS1]|nr:hypothetical protein TI03_03320 [Achromatium sp. WMS1]
MLQFNDLFVIQIIGDLLSRHYIGTITLLCEDPVPTKVWLNKDGVTHVQRGNINSADALHAIIWRTQGEITLNTVEPALEIPAIDFPTIVERFIANTSRSFSSICAALKQSYIQIGAIGALEHNETTDAYMNLLQNIPIDGIELANIATNEKTFWPSFLYLCGRGFLVCSYGPTLGNLLQTFEQELLMRITKFFGAGVAKSFSGTINTAKKSHWPDWNTDKHPDSIYGTAPYYVWVDTIQVKISTLGIPTLAKRCLEQTIDSLSNSDATLIRHLLTSAQRKIK